MSMKDTVHESVVGQRAPESAKEKYGKGTVESLRRMYEQRQGMKMGLKADAQREKEDVVVTETRTRRKTNYLDDGGFSF